MAPIHNPEFKREPVNWSKYLFTFIITGLIFSLALYINHLIDNSKVSDIRSIQDAISLNLLSSETQFDLLKETSCKNVNDNILSTELNDLERKLSYLESSDPSQNSAEFLYIKQYYELLQIKDFLLMKQLNEKCDLKPIAILYFYGAKSECPDCDKTSTVLSYLRQQYPDLRIYSFDTRLSMSAVQTLAKIYKIQPPYPILVINDEVYQGFKSVDDMKNIIPELKQIDKQRELQNTASSTASSTNAKSASSTGI
jgi:thiol-disulfide isomerase/thioredoxin